MGTETVVSEGLGGARRDRTADLLHAMQALSQLSYSPTERATLRRVRGPRGKVARNLYLIKDRSWYVEHNSASCVGPIWPPLLSLQTLTSVTLECVN